MMDSKWELPDKRNSLEGNSLEEQVASWQTVAPRAGIRKRSQTMWWGLPLYEIAMGPDVKANERHGHARGVIAIGDIATGLLAVGGIARGFVAVGGVAIGAICLGGLSLGLLLGLGGLATGVLAFGGLAIGVLAIGGGAVGVIAVGGGALGYYACGGGALGKYVISSMQQDPQAVAFFDQWLPIFKSFLRPPGG